MRLAKGGRVGKRFGDGLAGCSPGEAELGIMARVVGLGAMAGRLSTTPHLGRDRPGPEVAQAQELIQELGAFVYQGCEVSRHESLSVRIYPLRTMPQKKKNRQP